MKLLLWYWLSSLPPQAALLREAGFLRDTEVLEMRCENNEEETPKGTVSLHLISI
jgi:hypothetical protein